MRVRVKYNEEGVDLDANVARWWWTELVEESDDYEGRDVLGHAIREYGPDTVEWLNSHEKKSKFAWEQWWEDTGRDQVSEFSNPHPQKPDTIYGERLTVGVYDDDFDVLVEQVGDLDHSLVKDDFGRFLAATLIRRRSSIREDVESGDVEPVEVE